jgi:hypothetical protein
MSQVPDPGRYDAILHRWRDRLICGELGPRSRHPARNDIRSTISSRTFDIETVEANVELPIPFDVSGRMEVDFLCADSRVVGCQLSEVDLVTHLESELTVSLPIVAGF